MPLLLIFRDNRQKEAWSNSSPNTTGAIQLAGPASATNITSRILHGTFGQRLPPGSKAMRALFMGLSSGQRSSGALTVHSWQMDRPLLCSRVIESNEIGRPQIGNQSPSRGVDTLRWRLRILLPVHFWKNVVERRGLAVKDLQSASAERM